MLAYCLRHMVFEPCKMEPSIWLLPYWEYHYEYVSVYVDNLLITSKVPKGVIDFLTTKHYFKLKRNGPISYHLGCSVGRDDSDL